MVCSHGQKFPIELRVRKKNRFKSIFLVIVSLGIGSGNVSGLMERFMRNLISRWFSWGIRQQEEQQQSESYGERGVPVIPPLNRKPDIGPNPTVAICGACGLELKQVMGYVCGRDDCPCFSKPRMGSKSTVDVCGGCGLDMKAVVSDVCQISDCPCRLNSISG